MLMEFKTEVETEYARQKDVAERDMARKGEVAKITASTEKMDEKLEHSYLLLNKKIPQDIKRTVNEMMKKSEGGGGGGGAVSIWTWSWTKSVGFWLLKPIRKRSKFN